MEDFEIYYNGTNHAFYVMDDLFWDIEVIDDWEEKMKELTTPESLTPNSRGFILK